MPITKTQSAEEIREVVVRVLGEIAPEADFTTLDPDADIRDTYDIDSFDFLNFLIGLDEALGVEIPEADYGQLNTLSHLTTYLQAHMK